MQRHVNDLRRLGYVEPQENPAHQRSVLIALTDAGTVAYAQIRNDELRRLAELAPECAPEDLAIAAAVLQALSRDVRYRADHQQRSEGDRP